MHHRKTYMYFNFQQNQVSRSVKTVYTCICKKSHKLHKFATTNSNFEDIDYFRHASSYNLLCIKICSKIWLADQSKPCTQIASGVNLQLPIVILKKSIISDNLQSYMYNCISIFRKNRVSRSVKTEHIKLFAKK